MKKIKRILALIGAILLIGMYASTLIFSLMKSELAHTLFQVSILCTIAVPVMLYGYVLVYRVLNNKDKDKNKDKD